jgi:hypothetical protein
MNEDFWAFADGLVRGAIVAASAQRTVGMKCTSVCSPVQLTLQQD